MEADLTPAAAPPPLFPSGQLHSYAIEGTDGEPAPIDHPEHEDGDTDDDERRAEERPPQPPSRRALDAARARRILTSADLLRPLRLLPLGTEAKWTVDDAKFFDHAMTLNLPIAFVPNPKRKGTTSHRRYMKYSAAKTLRQALSLGASLDDLKWDYRRAYIKFPTHESDLPGHIYNAIQTDQLLMTLL